jgi:hypothetical protein
LVPKMPLEAQAGHDGQDDDAYERLTGKPLAA